MQSLKATLYVTRLIPIATPMLAMQHVGVNQYEFAGVQEAA
jgi:hypothetical protein